MRSIVLLRGGQASNPAASSAEANSDPLERRATRELADVGQGDVKIGGQIAGGFFAEQ